MQQPRISQLPKQRSALGLNFLAVDEAVRKDVGKAKNLVSD